MTPTRTATQTTARRNIPRPQRQDKHYRPTLESRVRREFDYWVALRSADTKLICRNTSGNRFTLYLTALRTGAETTRPIFSMHRSQHKTFRTIEAHLRAVLAALVTPAPTVPDCTYSDYDSDWPASPFTPSAPTSQNATPDNAATYINPEIRDGLLMPAAAVGVQSQMSALASKSQTKQDKFAAVTERIMNDKKPASKGNFNPVKPKPTMPEINSVYRNNCKADAAMLANETGI